MDEQLLKEDIFRILCILSSDREFTQRELAQRVGFSLGKTNYLLNSLIKRNLVEMKTISSKEDKSKKVKYVLTESGTEEETALAYHFLKKKEDEYNRMKQEWERLQAVDADVVSVKAAQERGYE